MKILFAIQGTGNGHLSRARDIIPHLQNYGELDLMVSGTQAQVSLTQGLTYKKHGFSFVFGKNGGIDYLGTAKIIRLGELFKDIRFMPVEKYDLIINDFEPITAWACKWKKIPSVALSHQSAFLSSKTPKVKTFDLLGPAVLKNYAPSTYQVGFHFARYDDFIYTPIIRKEIRELVISNNGHYTVYLPAFDDVLLVNYLTQLPDVKWQVFSKHNKENYTNRNVEVIRIDNAIFNKSLSACAGLLTGGGFESPAEALFMGKKVFAIPMKGQYEQQCNAEALRLMGVPVMYEINQNFVEKLKIWVAETQNIKVDYPEETAKIVEGLMKYKR